MTFILMNARNSPVWEGLLENGGIIKESKLIKLTVFFVITAMSGGGGGGVQVRKDVVMTRQSGIAMTGQTVS